MSEDDRDWNKERDLLSELSDEFIEKLKARPGGHMKAALESGKCESCGDEALYLSPTSSQYQDDETSDHNRPEVHCDSCSKDHIEYWEEMWADYYYYYSGIM